MNLTNIFFEAISLTNLVIFVNRLIVDGNYKTALLLYDYTSVRDTRFIQELISPSKGNHNSIILRSADSLKWIDDDAKRAYLQTHDELPIVMMDFDQKWSYRMLNLMTPMDRSAYNYVLLFPMQQNIEKWRILTKMRTDHVSFLSNSIVFYQTPRTALDVPTNKSLEVFVNSICYTANCSIFDIDSQADILIRLNRIGNLHEFLFEKAKKKTILYVGHLDANLTVNHLNIMLNDANWYMANFITLNMKGLTLTAVNKNCYYEPKTHLIYKEMFLPSWDCSHRSKL